LDGVRELSPYGIGWFCEFTQATGKQLIASAMTPVAKML
jgi:hypothetical protein